MKRNEDLNLGAKDRVHSYIGAGFELPLSKIFTFKPMIILRKVKSLPLSKDIGGFLSISNKFDLGISHRSNSSFSVMTLVKISKSFDIGYAYEAPTNTSLLNQSIKTNEFFLRFKFEKNEKEDLPEKTKDESM